MTSWVTDEQVAAFGANYNLGEIWDVYPYKDATVATASARWASFPWIADREPTVVEGGSGERNLDEALLAAFAIHCKALAEGGPLTSPQDEGSEEPSIMSDVPHFVRNILLGKYVHTDPADPARADQAGFPSGALSFVSDLDAASGAATPATPAAPGVPGAPLSGQALVASIDSAVGNTNWRTEHTRLVTGQEVVDLLDAATGGTAWRTEHTEHTEHTTLRTAQEVSDLLDGLLGSSWRTSGAGAVDVSQSLRLPVGTVALRMGWTQTQNVAASTFIRANAHPADGAAVGTVAGLAPPPFPPALSTDLSLYLFIWIGAPAADIADIRLSGGRGSLIGSISAGAPYELEGEAGTVYVSNQRLSAALSAFTVSAVVGGSLIASQPWTEALLATHTAEANAHHTPEEGGTAAACAVVIAGRVEDSTQSWTLTAEEKTALWDALEAGAREVRMFIWLADGSVGDSFSVIMAVPQPLSLVSPSAGDSMTLRSSSGIHPVLVLYERDTDTASTFVTSFASYNWARVETC